MYRPPIAKGEKHNRLITIECDMCNETVLLSFYVIAIPWTPFYTYHIFYNLINIFLNKRFLKNKDGLTLYF